MSIAKVKNGRAWAVIDDDGTIIALVLYKRGAIEIVRRLTAAGKDTRR